MKQGITGFHLDDASDWVAELACGHHQHVRHNPPWINRPWVNMSAGRQSMIDHELSCKKCEAGAPPVISSTSPLIQRAPVLKR